MLPNKVVSYNESAFPSFVCIKKILHDYGRMNVDSLWLQSEGQVEDIVGFIQALESLYALNLIDFANDEVVINA